MKFVYNDGGRSAAGFRGVAGDCVVRAIAIASGLPYKQVYDSLNKLDKKSRTKYRGSPRTGMYRKEFEPYMKSLGAVRVPCMKVGSGCKVHLRDDELPKGHLVVQTAKHLCAVIDGVLHDIFDSSAPSVTIWNIPGHVNEKQITYRCVYGYWVFPENHPE